MCFVFAVLAVLHPVNGSYRGRASSYREHMCKYVFPKTFPVTFPQDVGAFERNNCVSVNVFGYDSEKNFVYPLKVVDDELEQHVDLLLVEDHFVGITNFARLFFFFFFKCQKPTLSL
uniref:Putative secreted protein n=1 Tax=Ixodes ricinus TaxID=34613 RepID=A0A6B0ULP0_IXORI